MMDGNKSHLLSAAVQAQIETWAAKYPRDQRQSAVLSALHLAQEQNQGWLTEDLLDAVADFLNMPRVAVYEVATFYSMYDLQPVGRNKVYVCTNISCMLAGSEKIVQHLKNRLGIEWGETTADGRITLKQAECLAACANAPVMQVNKRYCEDLTPEKVDQILAALDAEESI